MNSQGRTVMWVGKGSMENSYVGVHAPVADEIDKPLQDSNGLVFLNIVFLGTLSRTDPVLLFAELVGKLVPLDEVESASP